VEPGSLLLKNQQPRRYRKSCIAELPLQIPNILESVDLMHRSQKVCPSCGSGHVSRSHRRGLIERYLLTALRIRAYRCDVCDNRFYRRAQPADVSANRHPSEQFGKPA
jgi:ribosomal protein L37AE/L43A